MTEKSVANINLAFFAGLYFALLQYSYFFLLEAFLSSQHVSYLVCVLFWLIGFLVGLNLRPMRLFTALLVLGLLSYYASWLLIRMFPFEAFLYPALGVCIALSGLLPGYFFTWGTRRFDRVKFLFFHENNGYVVGILVSLLACIYAGRWFLDVSPLAGGLFLGMVLLFDALTGRGQAPAEPVPAAAG